MATGYLAQYLKPLDPLIEDPGVIEIVFNGDGKCFVERRGCSAMARADAFDLSPADLRDTANMAGNTSKTKLTETSPLLSTSVEHLGAMLRVQAVIEPASRAGTVLSFRIFRPGASGEPKTFTFLRKDVTVSQEEERRAKLKSIQTLAKAGDVDAVLKAALDLELNTIISGGTSTGKTELGRRMLWLMDKSERLVTIEDSYELRPTHENVVSLIAERSEQSPRSADRLLQATLRLRPDRIIVGELRGSEAATFLEAINTGHGGSFTTLHATTARKAMDRLALMVMSKGTQLQYSEVMHYLKSTIDLVIQTAQDNDTRGIAEVYLPPLEGQGDVP